MRGISLSLIPNSLSRKFAKNLTLPICTLALVMGVSAAQAATCTPTGFVRDSINLTAAR